MAKIIATLWDSGNHPNAAGHPSGIATGMLNRLCLAASIPLVNVVRSPDFIRAYTRFATGAKYLVVPST
jgi:hypothetical protein